MGKLLATIGALSSGGDRHRLLHNPGYRSCRSGRSCAGHRGHLRKRSIRNEGAARRKMIVAFILMLEAIIFFRAVQPDANLSELLRYS